MPNLTDRVLKTLGLQRVFNPFLPGDFERILNGSYYPQTTMGNNKQEPIGMGFSNLATQAYADNPIVFACIQARSDLFSEARLVFQKMGDGVPGELTATPRSYLRLLETPYPGGTTSMLLRDALLDADLAGNAFIVRQNGLRRMRPDWVTIIAGNPRKDATTWDIDTEIIGYGYQPGGPQGGQEKVYYQREQVAHFKSTHDPLRRFSGMSWLLPVLKEIMADGAATGHKTKFWENAATPNMAIKFAETMTKAQAQDWIDLFHKEKEGAANAYKTLFLGGGSDMVPIGANLQQADFGNVQAGGELRIASAAGVPPIVVGLRGGLDAATYSNYGQARRAFADLKMRPLWRDFCGALQTITSVPENSRLWFDPSDISFLQEDMKDRAEIQSVQAAAIRQLVDAGFEPESIKKAIGANDYSRLTHTGLFSVQLQPPGSQDPAKPLQPNEIIPAETNAAPVRAEIDIRCNNCDRLVAKRTAPGGGFEIKCRGCSTLVAA